MIVIVLFSGAILSLSEPKEASGQIRLQADVERITELEKEVIKVRDIKAKYCVDARGYTVKLIADAKDIINYESADGQMLCPCQ